MSEQENNTTWARSDSIGELVKARIAAAPSIRHAEKNAVNPHLRNKYADLQAVFDALSAIHDHGLALFHFPGGDTSNVQVTAMLAHTSGEWMSCTISIKPDKPTAQGMGSAITYARRYTAAALLGISQTDDDGNDASGTAPRRQQAPAPAQARPPAKTQAPAPAQAPSNVGVVESFSELIEACQSTKDLNSVGADIKRNVSDPAARAELTKVYKARLTYLQDCEAAA